MPLETDYESADALTAAHDDRAITNVRMRARRANGYDGIEGRARPGTVCGERKPGPQSGRENSVELAEGSPTYLDLEKDPGDRVGELLRVLIRGETLLRVSASSLLPRSDGAGGR